MKMSEYFDFFIVKSKKHVELNQLLTSGTATSMVLSIYMKRCLSMLKGSNSRMNGQEPGNKTLDEKIQKYLER